MGLNIGSFFAGAQATGGGVIGMLGQFSSISLGLTALTGKSIHGLLTKEGPAKETAKEVKDLIQPGGQVV